MEEFAYDPTTDLHPVLQNMDTLLKSGRLRPDSLLMQLNARQSAVGANIQHYFYGQRVWHFWEGLEHWNL